MVQSPDSLVSILNFFMGFAYVIGLHAVQFGNNWMKKFRGQPKYGLVQFACQRNVLKQNKTKKQNNIHSNKKPKAFANEPPSANKTFFSALSQGLCADWLVCTVYCIS